MQAFSPNILEIIDDSHLHRGHAGAASGAGHYRLIIASEAFKGLSTVASHQKIYAALAEMMGSEIHALSISVQVGYTTGQTQ